MGAAVSVHFDTQRLSDALLIEAVPAQLWDNNDSKQSAQSRFASVMIDIGEDGIVDDLVEALTKVQHDRKKQRLAREVQRLTSEWTSARDWKAAKHNEWSQADEDERACTSKLRKAEQALALLTAQEGS